MPPPLYVACRRKHQMPSDMDGVKTKLTMSDLLHACNVAGRCITLTQPMLVRYCAGFDRGCFQSV